MTQKRTLFSFVLYGRTLPKCSVDFTNYGHPNPWNSGHPNHKILGTPTMKLWAPQPWNSGHPNPWYNRWTSHITSWMRPILSSLLKTASIQQRARAVKFAVGEGSRVLFPSLSSCHIFSVELWCWVVGLIRRCDFTATPTNEDDCHRERERERERERSSKIVT